MPRNLRSELFLFLGYLAGRRPRRLRWVEGQGSDGPPTTRLELRDVLPRPPYRRGSSTRLTITSEHERLIGHDFGSVASKINKVGAKGHGRTLTCLGRAGAPLAALSYHLDPQGAVLLVTAIAVLENPASPPDGELSRALAGVLLCYLALAAQDRNLPARLGFAPSTDDRDLALRLGFRSSGGPATYSAAGNRYMEWRPPRPISG
jgi:hypothetical protein